MTSNRKVNETEQKTGALVRRLGPLDATMIVVGSMIGSGIFLTSAESARLTGAPGWLILAWAVAGVMTITGALCCSELAAMMPRAGGVYVFLREAYGPSLGFLFGWTLFLVIQTGTIAAVAIAFAKFTGVFAPAIAADHYLIRPIHLLDGYAISLSTEQLVAIALILLLTWTNTRGLETGRFVQNTFTFAKTAALLALIVIGLSLGWKPESAARSSDWWNSWANGWTPQGAQPGLLGWFFAWFNNIFGRIIANAVSGTAVGAFSLVLLFGKAMVGPLFAQTAWTNVTFIGSEVRDPGRNLARALLGGCALVVVLYVAANLAYVAVLPLAGIQRPQGGRLAVAAMESIFGEPGKFAMAAAIMVSTFGCNNGLILAGARVYYAMARDGLFFHRIAAINRRSVPAAALVAQAIWTIFLTLPRTVNAHPAPGADPYGNVYTQLLEYIVSADLVFYILLVVAVIVLRKTKPDAPRPYRTWGYPLVPIVSVVLAAFLIVDLAYLAPTTSGIGYLLVLTGIPVYFIWRRGFSVDRSA